MQRRVTVVLGITFLLISMSACTGSAGTSTIPTSTTTLTTLPPTTTTTTSTTIPPTTTTSTTTTTTTIPRTTTTTEPPPPKVTGVTAGLGGGSGEVFVQWNASPAGDLARYLIRYSENPGGTKSLLAQVPANTTEYIDFPRALTEGLHCYVVIAVDTSDSASTPSNEACFSAS